MSSQQREETQITIIGASQSGKTTLAAGLAKTSNEDFTVGFVDNATRDYLQPRIAGISAGHWPEATSGEDRDICLNINTSGGRSALISFKEYMGERIHDATYLEQIVGSPNGALILLSPGMESLRDPEEREELIGNLKGVVDHLKCNKCVAIAFVVTACDRLKTDLRDFAEEFGNYAAEVVNYLNTSGMDWKRFDVTITGELADQQKPSIAVGDRNTAREPFVWIMDRVAGRKHMTVAMRVGGWLSVMVLTGVAIFGAILGSQCYSEYSVLKAREKRVAEIENRIASATQKKSESDLKIATDDLFEQIATNKTRQCRFQCCETRRTNDVAVWTRIYDEARVQYFSVSMDKREEHLGVDGSEVDCAKFEGWLSEFAPVDSTMKSALINRWVQLRPRIRKGYEVERGKKFSRRLEEFKQKEKDKSLLSSVREFKDDVSIWKTDFESSQNIRTNVLSGAELLIQSIEAELDLRKGNELQNQIDDMTENAATKATVDEVEKLRQNIVGWEPYTDKGERRKCEIRKNLEDNKPRWEQTYLDNCCTTNADAIARKIRALKPNDSSLRSDDICDTMKTAYGFTSEWKKASANVLSVATNKICEASSKFLSDFLNSFTDKWDVLGKKEPEISNDDKDFIVAALDLANPDKPSEKLATSFLSELEKSLKDALARWREHQRKIASAYIKTLESKSAEDAYGDYRRWYDLNSANPFVTNVDSVVVTKIGAFFDKYIEEVKITFLQNEAAFNSAAGRDQAKKRYDEFKNICLAVAADCSRNPNGLSSSWCALFAKTCVDSGKVGLGMNKAFEQGLVITKIEASAGDGQQFEPIEVKQWTEKWDGNSLINVANELIARWDNPGVGWRIVSDTKRSLFLNPWTKSGFWVYAEVDELGLNPSGTCLFRMFPRPSDYQMEYVEKDWWVGEHHCFIRIYCNLEGPNIFQMHENARKK